MELAGRTVHPARGTRAPTFTAGCAQSSHNAAQLQLPCSCRRSAEEGEGGDEDQSDERQDPDAHADYHQRCLHRAISPPGVSLPPLNTSLNMHHASVAATRRRTVSCMKPITRRADVPDPAIWCP